MYSLFFLISLACFYATLDYGPWFLMPAFVALLAGWAVLIGDFVAHKARNGKDGAS